MIFLTLLFQVGNQSVDRFNGYLLLGYIILGLMAVVYILYLWNQQRNIEQDLQLLQQLLEEEEGAEG
ncbi:MAG TPA: hypothetical protein ENJ56_02325 [Anaerolineae bacterium]|nr:hypothetical protein [Anaerolineae bacterium]